ncbi:MAG: response regulator [Acidobacteriota bacterium]
MVILQVEDSPTDEAVTAAGFSRLSRRHEIFVVRDGVEALDFLHHKGQYSSAPRPELILLDVALPKLDGFGVLKEIKKETDLQSIPVVMFSSSDSEYDRCAARDLRASEYVVKPAGFPEYMRAIEQIESHYYG